MTEKKKLLIIISAGLSIFILSIIIVSIIFYRNKQIDNKNNSNTPVLEKYTDPGSGEVIYSTKGKVKEEATIKESGGIIYFGFSELINKGMKINQVDKVKAFFLTYKVQKDKTVKEISITVSSIRKVSVSGADKIRSNEMTFETTINRKDKYKTKIEYSGLYNAKIKLYNPDETKLIYSSDEIYAG